MAPVAHPRLALRRFTSTLAAAVGSTGSQRAVLLRQTAQVTPVIASPSIILTHFDGI